MTTKELDDFLAKPDILNSKVERVFKNQNDTTGILTVKVADKEFVIPSVSRKNRLGSGCYGAVYPCFLQSGNSRQGGYVCKVIESLTNRENFLKEAIIQIILMKFTEAAENGPYVPMIYGVSINSANYGFVISQKMTNNLERRLLANDINANETFIPYLLNEIASMLSYIEKPLQFNHRDLKTDNIMYNNAENGNIKFKLIDFGFSCLTWGNLHISKKDVTVREGEVVFKGKCYKEGRDLAQFIFNINMEDKKKPSNNIKMSPTMKAWLNTLLNRLPQYNWGYTYAIFNQNNAKSKLTTPLRIKNAVRKYTRRTKNSNSSRNYTRSLTW